MAQLAAAEAKASMQVEIASLTERLSGTSDALQTERRENSIFRQSAETWRTALDEAGNEIAALAALPLTSRERTDIPPRSSRRRDGGPPVYVVDEYA